MVTTFRRLTIEKEDHHHDCAKNGHDGLREEFRRAAVRLVVRLAKIQGFWGFAGPAGGPRGKEKKPCRHRGGKKITIVGLYS